MKRILVSCFLIFLFSNTASASFVVDARLLDPILPSGRDLFINVSITCTVSRESWPYGFCGSIRATQLDIYPVNPDLALLLDLPIATWVRVPWRDLCPVGTCIGSVGSVELFALMKTAPDPIDPEPGPGEFYGKGDVERFQIGMPSPVPVPTAVWLFGTALIGLVGFIKRRKAPQPLQP